MSFRLAKLRFRRVFRRRRRQLADASSQADEHLTKHFFRRLHHLLLVRRFVALWTTPLLILIALSGWQTLALSGYYQHLAPAPGGIYREGIIGQFTNANPIYATTNVDQSVAKLVFAGLFKYNSKNELVGDLASGYTLSKDGRTYTIQLRPDLTWQDGEPLTAEDVVYTYQTIQDPLAQSPYYSSWQGVEVSAAGEDKVVFELPNPLASFKYSLTNGIVPKHILGKLLPRQLRSASFNTMSPIGAGPFAWADLSVEGNEPAVRQELIALKPFADYHAGEPKIGSLVLHAYPTDELAEKDLKAKSVDGLAGLETIPAELKQRGIEAYSMPQTAETLVFFKESNPILKNANVRRALILASDRQQIVNGLPYPADVQRSPFLPSQLGYSTKYLQPTFDLIKAKKILKDDGWIAGSDGIAKKDGQSLTFDLYSLDNPILNGVADMLKQQWRALGADVRVISEDQTDFQNDLSAHNYDAVLNTISLGVDSDEYIYWDSSQADIRSASRLNLSEVKDARIDASIEAGRTRNPAELRAVKYQKFLSAWIDNAPALVLYQPRFLYVVNGDLYNFDGSRTINNAVGRYNNIMDWEIRQSKVTN